MRLELEHIHPMIVHFPIVLAIVAVLLDLWRIGRSRGRPPANGVANIGTVLLGLAGLSAVFAYVFGDLAYDVALQKGFSEAQLETHEGWGTITTVVLVVVALVRIAMWRRKLDAAPAGAATALALSLLAAAMVMVTAYFGGHLVYNLGVNVASAAG
jgi:uncharacterized membrane protein